MSPSCPSRFHILLVEIAFLQNQCFHYNLACKHQPASTEPPLKRHRQSLYKSLSHRRAESALFLGLCLMGLVALSLLSSRMDLPVGYPLKPTESGQITSIYRNPDLHSFFLRPTRFGIKLVDQDLVADLLDPAPMLSSRRLCAKLHWDAFSPKTVSTSITRTLLARAPPAS